MNPSELVAAQKRAARQRFLELGTPAFAVDEMIDLAFHAAEQARKRLTDLVTTGSSSGVILAATGLACGIMRAHLDSIEATCIEQGRKHNAFHGFTRIEVTQ